MPSGDHLKSKSPKGPKPNGQLYKNSGLAGLFADAEPAADALFGAKDPNLQIKHEKPEHRYILWMKANGSSNREIARQTDYTEAWLSQLFRQPWAQAQLVQMMKESGKGILDQTLELIQGEAVNSVLKLVDIRDDPDTPKAVQRACSVDIIEQFLGKPKQKVEVQENANNSSVEDLDKKLAELEKQEQQLRGNLAHV
jgi:hypothetical protein